MKKNLNEKVLAIIPARSGSKRIKNKNIKYFFGKPFIYYAISAAKKARIFDNIIVSTDTKKISNIAKKYGAEVPFLRSKKLSNDKADTISVVKNCILNLEKKKKFFKYTCCIYPANPFLKTKNIKKAFKIIKSEDKIEYVFTATKYNHPIERSFKLSNNGYCIKNSKNLNQRTQDIKDSYHDGAQFYFSKTSNWKKKKKIFSKNSKPIILSEIECHDIDNPIDLRIAEIKFKLKKKK